MNLRGVVDAARTLSTAIDTAVGSSAARHGDAAWREAEVAALAVERLVNTHRISYDATRHQLLRDTLTAQAARPELYEWACFIDALLTLYYDIFGANRIGGKEAPTRRVSCLPEIVAMRRSQLSASIDGLDRRLTQDPDHGDADDLIGLTEAHRILQNLAKLAGARPTTLSGRLRRDGIPIHPGSGRVQQTVSRRNLAQWAADQIKSHPKNSS